MKRREFIAGLGAAAWALTARAQQGGRMRRVGVLAPFDENDPVGKLQLSALRQTLADLGWTDGRNVRMDFRWAPGSDINRMQALARELVGLQPDIIVTNGTPTTAALRRETRTIPIVFAGVSDPVASGIVSRLDRPSENITGFVLFEPSLGGKWLELLSEIAPGLKRLAIMFNPDTTPASVYMPSVETAARSLKIVPIPAPVHSDVAALCNTIPGPCCLVVTGLASAHAGLPARTGSRARLAAAIIRPAMTSRARRDRMLLSECDLRMLVSSFDDVRR
jgi:putative tryptophan/tyrosine transport system substrate-binding protein